MSKVLCDAMDCKNIGPMETVTGREPFLGYCKKRLVNIIRFSDGCMKCISYKGKDGKDEG